MAQTERINVAIIGSGFMGAAHLDALRRVPNVDVVAIASADPPRARELVRQFAVPHFTEDWRELLGRDDIHAFHNTTPNNLHYEINKALIEAGKHVLSEKPLTMTSAESTDLVRLARERGVVNAINFNYRGYPLVQQAHGMVRRGELGELFLVHGHYLQDWLLHDTDYNWRLESQVSGASRAIADIGSHWCDLVQFVTGRKIRRVFAHLFRAHETRKKPKRQVETYKGKELGAPQEYDEVPIDTEDGGFVLAEFEGGQGPAFRGSLVVSQVSAGRKNRQWIEVDGSRGALSWNQEEPNRLWIGRRDEPNEVLIKDPALLDANARGYAHYPGGHPEGYPDGPRNLFRNFYRYIGEGRRPGKDAADFPTFEDGHWEVLIVEAVLRSHAQRAWVDVEASASVTAGHG
ncbi:MAG TPA: Gfo/Idh/MocA family oxidoreductase [Gemmatimonadaceae bacterium]|nr:Gfo/Idh/MocA family oxidoreductase [Gemmatimonadaceae bacterium]